MSFQAVLFDMDGLFIDSEPDWHEAETEMMKSFGYDWSNQDQLACLGGPLSRVTQYMSSLLEGKKSAEELGVIIIDEMVRRLSGKATFMPGALEFSRTLNQLGYKQALVSASPRALVNGVLDGMKEHFFSFSVASGDIERTKPFPDPYLHAAKLLDVDIKECLIFEDSPTGVTAATASEAFVVAIPHYIAVQESSRLKVISSFLEVENDQLDKWSQANRYELGRSL